LHIRKKWNGDDVKPFEIASALFVETLDCTAGLLKHFRKPTENDKNGA
jgi:hypothetical protein